jgi:heat shock protein HtpX
MAYSRKREYLADAGAVELTRNPLGLASALQKLSEDDEPLVDTANRATAHMYIVNPLRKMRQAHQELNSMLLSHPPIKDRIARLLALAR